MPKPHHLRLEPLEGRFTPIVGAFGPPIPVEPGGIYDGVVGFYPGGGAGLLTTGRHLLTAAHVQMTYRLGMDVIFHLPGGDVAVKTKPGGHVAPGWNGDQLHGFERGNDLAVVELETLAPIDAPRYDIYRGSSETGKTFTFVTDYGDHLVKGYNRFDMTGAALADDLALVRLSQVPTGGSFHLFVNGVPTAAIPAAATAAQVQTALEAVVGRGNVLVAKSGGAEPTYGLRFTGALAGRYAGPYGFNDNNLQGATVRVDHVNAAGRFSLADTLISDFDTGIARYDNLGLFYGLNNTGLPDGDYASQRGDSGSPVFLDGKIVAVVSGGINSPGTPSAEDIGTEADAIGSLQLWPRVSRYADWVDGVIGQRPYDLNVEMSVQPAGRDGGADDEVVLNFDTANNRFGLTANDRPYVTESLTNLNTVELVGSPDGEAITITGRVRKPLRLNNRGDFTEGDAVLIAGAVETDFVSHYPVAVFPGGKLAPGGVNYPGTAEIFNAVLFLPGSTFEVEVGTGDQLLASSVALSGNLTVHVKGTPALGQKFTIIANRGSSPTDGYFEGLPEGTVATLDGHRFRVSYRGGDGNDVTLTYVGQPPVWKAGHNLSGQKLVLYAGQRLERTLLATDPRGQLIDYAVSSGPAGLTYHPQDGFLSFEPLASQAGRSHAVVLAAADPEDNVITQTFAIEVRPADPEIARLTASPGTINDAGTTVLSLTAVDVSTPFGNIDRVEFWLDRNGNGRIDDQTDNLFSTDEDGADGYSFRGYLGGVAVGTATVMARARRYSFNSVFYSNTVSARLTVVAAPPPVLEVKTLGGETRVHSSTSGTQQGGHVTQDQAGNVWAFWNATPGGQAYMQRYDSNGNALGSPVALDGVVGAINDVAMNRGSDKAIAIAWGNNGLKARKFQPDGTPLDDTWSVYDGVYRGGSGRIAIHFERVIVTCDAGEYYSEQVYFKLFRYADELASGTVKGVTGSSGFTRASDVTFGKLGEGTAFITFVHMPTSGVAQVKMIRLSPAGELLTPSYQTLSSRPAGVYTDDASTAVAPLNTGGVVVAWAGSGSPPDEPSTGIYARRFSSAGTPVEPREILVSDDFLSGRQDSPSVVSMGNDVLVVTWTSQGQDTGQGTLDLGVYGQQFGPDGQKRGDNFRAHTTLPGDQTTRYSAGGLAASNSNTRFVVGWQGAGPGDAAGVFLQRYEVKRNDAPTAAGAAAVAARGVGVLVDLRTLAADAETPADGLAFAVRDAVNGTVTLEPDGHTAWFAPKAGYVGPAGFTYDVTDQPRYEYPAATASAAVTVDVREQLSDADGDAVTIKLTGPGKVAVEGALARIVLSGTTGKSALAVTVGPGGDGQANVGSITGTAAGRINAPSVNLTGEGVAFSGWVGSVTVRDVRAGAAIVTGGQKTQRTAVTAASFAAGTAVRTTAKLSLLKAAGGASADVTAGGLTTALIGGSLTNATWAIAGSVGTITVTGTVDGWSLTQSGGAFGGLALGDVVRADVTAVDRRVGSIKAQEWRAGSVVAGGLTTLAVTGGFRGAVTLSGRGATGNVLGSAKVGAAVTDSVFAVAGSVGSFSAGRFLDSRLLAGFVAFDAADPMAGGAFLKGAKIGSFRTVLQASEDDFRGSVLAAATVGRVTLGRVGGVGGVLADVAIAAVTVSEPAFVFNARLKAPQGFADFLVQLV